MGLFGFGKNRDVVDLAERYRRQKDRENGSAKTVNSESSSSNQGPSTSPFSFFDSGSSSSMGSSSDSNSYESDSDGFVDITSASTEKRRKLAKRILDMTTKLEDISNQLYHLQQRMDVIEKKLNVRSFD